ncbi:MAG: hypothetical protein KDC98_23765, partial [Planctomycetes bacterium]|nr:hypothetical protein [Planctomycetota bacterium]
MSFASRHLFGFAVAVTVVLAGSMTLPRPYREGVAVERTTGRPVAAPWRRLADWRDSGDLGVVADGVRQLHREHPTSRFARGLLRLVERETGAPEFDTAVDAMAPVETFFAGVDNRDGIDARAAALRRRLDVTTGLPPGQLLALASHYRRLGRRNAEWRWLSRAFARHPESVVAADGLMRLCVEHGRLEQAVAVATRHSADRTRDLPWQRHLAQLGAWLSRPELETAALEHIVALESDPTDRARLIALYSHLGTPERGLPHAIALADGAAETAAAEEAASAALRDGFVEEGLAMLQRAAERAPEASPWLQRYAELAMQDLRTADVQRALETAAATDPDGVDRTLEDLYRRTDRAEELADLLQRRLCRHPGDARLWHELITLRSALGQRQAARLLARQRDVALADPESFVASLPAELRASAGKVRSQALALSMANSAEGAV